MSHLLLFLAQANWFVEFGMVVVVASFLFAVAGVSISRLLMKSAAAQHCWLLGTLTSILIFPILISLVPNSWVPSLDLIFSPTSSHISVAMGHSADSILPGCSTHLCENEGAEESAENCCLNSPADTQECQPVAQDCLILAVTPDQHQTSALLVSGWYWLVSGLWLLGSLIVTVRLLVCWNFLGRLMRNSQPFNVPQEIRHRLQTKYQGEPIPAILLTYKISNAVSAGLFAPVILVNRQLPKRLTTDQFQDVLDHEMAHLVRGDRWVLLLEQMARIIFWFNPAIYWLIRDLAASRERLCDNHVLADRPAIDYGQTLLRVAELTLRFNRSIDRASLATMGMLSRSTDLQWRVHAILDSRQNRQVKASLSNMLTTAVALMVAGYLFCGVSLGLSGQRQTESAKEETSVPELANRQHGELEEKSIEKLFWVSPSSTISTCSLSVNLPDEVVKATSDEDKVVPAPDLVKQKLSEWKPLLQDEEKFRKGLHADDADRLLSVWALVDLPEAIELEPLFEDHRLKHRFVDRLAENRRWDAIAEMDQRSDKWSDQWVLYWIKMAHRGMQRQDEELIALAKQNSIDAVERFRDRSVAWITDTDLLNMRQQDIDHQAGLTEFLTEIAELELRHREILQLAREGKLPSGQPMEEAQRLINQRINQILQTVGKIPMLVSNPSSRGSSENNVHFARQFVALESWIPSSTPDANERRWDFTFTMNDPWLNEKRHNRLDLDNPLTAGLIQLTPNLRIDWLTGWLPEFDSEITTPWVVYKVQQGQWEVPLHYLMRVTDQPWDRLRLLAIVARMLDSQEPAVAAKLRELIRIQAENLSAVENGTGQQYKQMETLAEFAITAAEMGDRTTAQWSLNQALPIFADIEAKANERSASGSTYANVLHLDLYRIRQLVAHAVLAGQLPEDNLPESIASLLASWKNDTRRIQAGQPYMYTIRGHRRSIPEISTEIGRTEKTGNEKFDQLLEQRDWLQASLECQQSHSKNSAWEPWFARIGKLSYQDIGLAETLDWAAKLDNPKLRLLIELGAIEAALDVKHQDTKDPGTRIEWWVPLLVWPKWTAC